MYSKKRERKVRRGNNSSINIYLGSEVFDYVDKLPTMPKHPHLVSNYTLAIIGPSSIPSIISTPYPPKKKHRVQSRKGKEKAINSNLKDEPSTITVTIVGKKVEILASRIRITFTVPNDSLNSNSDKGSNRDEEDELDIII